MDETSNAFELKIEPQSDRYDAMDERWQDQAAQLYSALREDVGGTRKEVTLDEGDKGGTEAIILALGTSGAFVAALEAFKAWLSRDQGRKLEISYQEGDATKRIVVTADGMGKETFREVAVAAAARAGEQAWATGSTAHS